jgi:hypothetical protein
VALPLALALFLAASCSGAAPTGGTSRPAGEPIPVSDDEVRDADAFVAAYRSAICVRGVACEPRWSSVPDANAIACHPSYRDTIWADRVAAWRADRSRFDPEAARGCLEQLRRGQCDVLYDEHADPACEHVFLPNVGEGGACSRHTDNDHTGTECEEGLVCALGEECPGRCVRPAAAGDRCDAGVPCGPDFTCGEDGRCAAPPGRGAACEKANQCAGELVCVDGRCGDGSGRGERCTWTRPCRRELNCWLESFEDDAVGVCDAFALDEGRPCLGGEMVDSCRPNLVCALLPGSPYWGRCGPGAPIGQACDGEKPCAVGGRCVDGTCRRLVTPDVACSAEAVCPRSHVCTNGACAPLPGPGEPCGQAGCYLTECVDGTCAPADPVLGGDLVCLP